MKTASSPMQTHLQGNPTSLADLWKVKRTDGTILGFTTHDVDISYDSGDGDGTVVYQALTGIVNTATAGKSDLSTDNLEVTAFLESNSITETDLQSGVYDGAAISHRKVNWADLTMGDFRMPGAYVGHVKSKNGAFTAEVRGLADKLATVIGNTFGPTCRAVFGSGGPLSQVWLQTAQAKAAGGSDLPISASFTSNVKAGSRILVFVVTYDLSAGPTLSDSQTSTYSLLASQVSPNDHGVVTCAVYVSSAVSAGSLTVTLSGTPAGSNSFAMFGAGECPLLSGSISGSAQSGYQASGTTLGGGSVSGTTSTMVATFAWFDLLNGPSDPVGQQGSAAGQGTAPLGYSVPVNQTVFDSADASSYQQMAAAFQIPNVSGTFDPVWQNNANSKAIFITLALNLTGPVTNPGGSTSEQYLCHVDVSLYRQNGSVSSAADAVTVVPNTGLTMVGSATPSAAAGADWFDDGVITFTSGVLDGKSFEIKTWDGTTLKLYLPMPLQPSASDTFQIEPGCDHTTGPDGCTRYNNILNFRGEPFIPGMDAILDYPNA